jgi:Fic family protein
MFIHERSEWPHFRWQEEKVTPKLAHVRYLQGHLLGKMGELGFDIRQEASLEVLTSDVLKTSSIEGEILDPQSVRSSLAKKLGIEMVTIMPRDRYIDGVVDMLLDATRNYDNPLTQDRLFGWHALLFPTGRSGLKQIRVGAWRTEQEGPMQVVSGPIGREKVHFEAPEAQKVEGEMSSFLFWFNEEHTLDLVLKAGIAHLWFVTIHPFVDGNGRIGRALMDLLLTRSDQSKDRFYSMSAWIEKERAQYYDRLEWTQKGDLDITEWLLWFLECLEHAIKGSETLLESTLRKSCLWKKASAHGLNGRQTKILNLMLGDFEGHLTTGKYAKIAKCSQDTALRDIKELLSYNLLQQNPEGGRSTSYILV